MGTRGPIATNPKLVALRGNPGKRSAKKRVTAKKNARPPTAPKFLNARARRKFKQIAKMLHDMDVLRVTDTGALAAYCEAWAEYVEACERIETEGCTTESVNGHVQPSPWLSIRNNARRAVMQYSRYLGLTPLDRERLTPETKEKEDPFEGFLNARSRSGS